MSEVRPSSKETLARWSIEVSQGEWPGRYRIEFTDGWSHPEIADSVAPTPGQALDLALFAAGWLPALAKS